MFAEDREGGLCCGRKCFSHVVEKMCRTGQGVLLQSLQGFMGYECVKPATAAWTLVGRRVTLRFIAALKIPSFFCRCIAFGMLVGK